MQGNADDLPIHEMPGAGAWHGPIEQRGYARSVAALGRAVGSVQDAL